MTSQELVLQAVADQLELDSQLPPPSDHHCDGQDDPQSRSGGQDVVGSGSMVGRYGGGVLRLTSGGGKVENISQTGNYDKLPRLAP